MKTKRNSSFELLRLFCILGITVMHSFVGIDTSSSIFNTEMHVLFNALFNTGVSCFILISGYFGIKFDLKKLIRMEFMILFFTLFSTIILGDLGIKTLIKACIPVLSRRYWFITCYFALCILAPFLNEIPKHMERKNFKNFLLVLLLVFSIIPTFTTYDIMQDAGKGLVHFIMIYLLGRYIALYKNEKHDKNRLLAGFFLNILIVFILDSVLTVLQGELYSTFARDCSIFMISASVMLLMYFKELSFDNQFINRIAGNVLAVTVLDSFLLTMLKRYFDLSVYANSVLLSPILLGCALIIVFTAIILNEIRKFTIGRLDNVLADLIMNIWKKVQQVLLRFTQTVLAFFIKSK